jgi:DNA-binding NarL/FixJ family response regulator
MSIAHDPSEAADQLEDRAFQVVLIDMKLPRGNGSDVFHLVRRATPQARTVLITGCRSEMDQFIDRAIAEGADAVCYKPFDVPQLLGSLQNLVRDPG